MACQGFDGQVARHDPLVQELMKDFVRVRIVQANAMDLSLLQFDYDLTFAAFFMNADRTIYGRYGSRSEQKNADKDISLEGFRKALVAALRLHEEYPANRSLLRDKQATPTRYKVPEEFPSLAGKYTPTLDYDGKVARSCMHCHQIRDAERVTFRSAGKPIPDEVLYPWPMPDAIGLSLDTAEKAKVKAVTKGAPADKAGFKPGDDILTLAGQPMISIADVQWVLHHAAQPARLRAEIQRQGKRRTLSLSLPGNWRRQSDISWRTTSWDLRRMAAGGLVLKDQPADERRKSNRSESDLALVVNYVGEYGEHAAGKRAGFKKDDVIISLDGQTGRMTESDLFRHVLQNRMPGTRIPVTVLRAGQRVDLELPVQ